MEDSSDLIELIIKISRSLKGKMVFDYQTSHLTMLQLQVLILLKNECNFRIKDIAGKFNVKMSTASSLIDRLSSAKMVLRKKDIEDRRIVHITLTKKGKKYIQEYIKQRKKIISNVLSYISSEDKSTLSRILKSISKKIEEEYER
jgi:DNA-binding MarR family transcriptional regulator